MLVQSFHTQENTFVLSQRAVEIHSLTFLNCSKIAHWYTTEGLCTMGSCFTWSVWCLLLLKSDLAQDIISARYSSSGILRSERKISLYSLSTWLRNMNCKRKDQNFRSLSPGESCTPATSMKSWMCRTAETRSPSSGDPMVARHPVVQAACHGGRGGGLWGDMKPRTTNRLP